jgi:hypothetical protein
MPVVDTLMSPSKHSHMTWWIVQGVVAPRILAFVLQLE